MNKVNQKKRSAKSELLYIANILCIIMILLYLATFLLPRKLELITVLPIGEEIGKSMFVLFLSRKHEHRYFAIAGITGLSIAAIEIAIRGGSTNLMAMGLIIHPILAMVTISFYKNGGCTWKAYAIGILMAATIHGMFNYILNFW